MCSSYMAYVNIYRETFCQSLRSFGEQCDINFECKLIDPAAMDIGEELHISHVRRLCCVHGSPATSLKSIPEESEPTCPAREV